MSERIGIVTDERAPDLTEDGQAVLAALERRGHDVSAVVWHDPGVAWDEYDAVLVRSCFDYHERYDAFLEWLDDVVTAGVRVVNPPGVIRWNAHKFYVRELAAAGIPVASTECVERGNERPLRSILERRGWERAVVKPAVGTSAVGVWRTSLAAADDHQERFTRELAEQDLLVQEYLPAVEAGEDSLAFFDGEFSHARRGIPAEGDFRAHHNFGGTGEPIDPPEDVVDQARSILESAADLLGVERLPYARVDGVVEDGSFVLLELELIEPYFGLLDADTDAVTAFVDAVEPALVGDHPAYQ